jgi:hypothetical protein
MKIHCNPNANINATIPEAFRDLQVNDEWLTSKGACSKGKAAFIQRFPHGATYPQVREWIASLNRQDWENWLFEKVGGDTATAGYKGTATAGYKGTATAGYKGTATAGNYGTATAGNYGTATAGDEGTATAGDEGTATAGEGGCIVILYYDHRKEGYRKVCAAVGEGGLKPNVRYKLDEEGRFVEA